MNPSKRSERTVLCHALIQPSKTHMVTPATDLYTDKRRMEDALPMHPYNIHGPTWPTSI